MLRICCPEPSKNEYAYFDGVLVVQAIWEHTQSGARPGTAKYAGGKRKKLRVLNGTLKSERRRMGRAILEATHIHLVRRE